MGSGEIEEAMAKAVEEDLIRTAAGVSIPAEVALQGCEVIKEFAKYIEEAGGTGNADAITGIMCILIDLALFETEETDLYRTMKIKWAWIRARDYLIYSKVDAKCLTCGREDKECL